jgi:hypothetical protein
MNALEPMMQSLTPLPPLHEMLVSMWDENNYMRFLNHIQLLSLMSWHCAYQRWHFHFNPHCHCQPNVNGFTSPILRNSSMCFLRCNSSQRKKLLQPTLSQPHFGQVWGWSPTLRKVGSWLKRRCRKCPRIGNSDICSPSYGQKKGWESNWQFDSWPLKVGNRPLPDVRFGIRSATWRWKNLDEG